MKPCCRVLRFLGDSHIPGCYLGECVSCGSIRHGSKSNWRVRPRNGKAMMIAIRERGERITRLRKPAKDPVFIHLDQFKTMEELMGELKRMGVVV